MGYKFIFDSNAIEPKSIYKMESAGLVAACDSGKFDFYMTHPLLRECAHFMTTGSMSQKAVRNLKFLIDIKWASFLNQLNGKDGILNMELAGVPEEEFLLVKNGEMIFKPELMDIINGKLSPEERQKKLEEDDRIWRNAKEKLINEALQKRTNLAISNIPSYEDAWEQFYPTIVEHYITGIANMVNPEVSAETLIDLWKKRKSNCRWLENFIKIRHFQFWYLITSKADPKRDQNAADDAEHMIYLLFVDGMVSNEKHGFMSNAKKFFPTKDFLSVDEFVERIQNG